MDMENEFKEGQLFDLIDEDGNTFTFELLDFVIVDEKLYAVLSTIDEEQTDVPEEEREMSVVIMLTEFEGKEPVFNLVEDEDLCQIVLDKFTELYDEEEEEEEESEE